MLLEERFWSKVDKTDNCWNWTAAKHQFGYGLFNIGGKILLAHRVVYALAVGPLGNFCVCHHCDNPGCVRPVHLFLGTQKDNVRDMMEKGRHSPQPRGLEDSEYEEITRRAKEGGNQRMLAAEFGISQSYVSLLKAGNRRC